MRTRLTALAICSLLGACTGDGERSDFYGSGGSAPPPGTPDTTTGNTDGDPPDDTDPDAPPDGDGDDTPLFDVGDGAGTGGPGDEEVEGCHGVDFLFVIDNSGSMADEQLNLLASFPGFIDAIESSLDEGAKDFHVMVVDTDDGLSLKPPAQPGECAFEIGAGLTTDSTQFPCGVPDGRRYMTSADPNMAGAFSCLAWVGTSGDPNERPIHAMRRAVGELAQPGACNEGFLRSDSILVVTFLTDEEDSDSFGDPAAWYDEILAAKGGDPNAVVMLGLFDDSDVPNPICGFGGMGYAQKAPRLIEFIELFGDQGMRGSVCAEDYSPILADAVGLIESTCESFVPPRG